MANIVELRNTHFFGDANLIAYYRLENINDSKGSYTLTNNNSVAFNAGQFSNCADFGSNNTNKSLTTTGISGINLSISNTISFWLRIQTEPTGSTVYRNVIWASSSGTARYIRIHYELIGGNKTLRATFGDNNIDYTVNLGTTSWYNIVATVDGSGNTAFYVNGDSKGTGTMGTGVAASNWLYLGGETATWASIYLDDVALFTRGLSASEAKMIYDYPSGGFIFNLI